MSEINETPILLISDGEQFIEIPAIKGSSGIWTQDNIPENPEEYPIRIRDAEGFQTFEEAVKEVVGEIPTGKEVVVTEEVPQPETVGTLFIVDDDEPDDPEGDEILTKSETEQLIDEKFEENKSEFVTPTTMENYVDGKGYKTETEVNDLIDAKLSNIPRASERSY